MPSERTLRDKLIKDERVVSVISSVLGLTLAYTVMEIAKYTVNLAQELPFYTEGIFFILGFLIALASGDYLGRAFIKIDRTLFFLASFLISCMALAGIRGSLPVYF